MFLITNLLCGKNTAALPIFHVLILPSLFLKNQVFQPVQLRLIKKKKERKKKKGLFDNESRFKAPS